MREGGRRGGVRVAGCLGAFIGLMGGGEAAGQ
jgi:hypothetical protein